MILYTHVTPVDGLLVSDWVLRRKCGREGVGASERQSVEREQRG